jgi:hypothetical protein
MDKLIRYLPAFTFLSTLIIGSVNIYYTIKRDRRERRKEEAERLQHELTQHEKGAYPPRKDKHQKR